MKHLPTILAIVLLLPGIVLMLGSFPFEADLPDWTPEALVGVGILLVVAPMLMSVRQKV